MIIGLSLVLILAHLIGDVSSIQCYDGSTSFGLYGVTIKECRGDQQCVQTLMFKTSYLLQCDDRSFCRMSEFMEKLMPDRNWSLSTSLSGYSISCCNESLCNAPEHLRSQLEDKLLRTTTTEKPLFYDLKTIEENHYSEPTRGGFWWSLGRLLRNAFGGSSSRSSSSSVSGGRSDWSSGDHSNSRSSSRGSWWSNSRSSSRGGGRSGSRSSSRGGG